MLGIGRDLFGRRADGRRFDPGQGHQPPGHALRDLVLPLTDHIQHLSRQGQQPLEISDRRARLANPLRNLLVAIPILRGQRLIGARFVGGAQVFALHVFDQRDFGSGVIIHLPFHDGGNHFQPGQLGGPPAPLTNQ